MKKYRRGVFIVVYKRNKKRQGEIDYLILKRKLHWKGWEFPKGGIEKKENIMNTIMREIKEETGQFPLKKTLKKHNYSGKYKYSKKLSDREGFIGQTFSLYSAEIMGQSKRAKQKIKIDKLEHSKYKWVNFEQALKKLTWPNQRKALRIVNKFLLKNT